MPCHTSEMSYGSYQSGVTCEYVVTVRCSEADVHKTSAFVHQDYVVRTKQKVSAAFLLYSSTTCVLGAEFISLVIDKTIHLPSSLRHVYDLVDFTL